MKEREESPPFPSFPPIEFVDASPFALSMPQRVLGMRMWVPIRNRRVRKPHICVGLSTWTEERFFSGAEQVISKIEGQPFVSRSGSPVDDEIDLARPVWNPL